MRAFERFSFFFQRGTPQKAKIRSAFFWGTRGFSFFPMLALVLQKATSQAQHASLSSLLVVAFFFPSFAPFPSWGAFFFSPARMRCEANTQRSHTLLECQHKKLYDEDVALAPGSPQLLCSSCVCARVCFPASFLLPSSVLRFLRAAEFGCLTTTQRRTQHTRVLSRHATPRHARQAPLNGQAPTAMRPDGTRAGSPRRAAPARCRRRCSTRSARTG